MEHNSKYIWSITSLDLKIEGGNKSEGQIGIRGMVSLR